MASTATAPRNSGLRETSRDKLAGLKPMLPDAIHASGPSSQISDGASAVLLMTEERAAALGVTPVVLSFIDELKADPDTINPNGGAIALGHPLGATGGVLITKAVHELNRSQGRYAVITMCCGGGLGTATLLERP